MKWHNIMLNKWFVYSVMMLSTLVSNAVLASDSPVDMVRDTTKQVLELLRKEDGKNTSKIREQVEYLVVPKFDFKRMTALALGKNWRIATAEQQDALAEQFQVLLVRTYASTMMRFKSAQVDIKPVALISNQGNDATVRSDITLAGSGEKRPVSVDYVLYKTPQSWKVYNINVEGASLVTVYRNQFDADIKASGVDGLIKTLKDKNH